MPNTIDLYEDTNTTTVIADMDLFTQSSNVAELLHLVIDEIQTPTAFPDGEYTLKFTAVIVRK